MIGLETTHLVTLTIVQCLHCKLIVYHEFERDKCSLSTVEP